MRVGINQMQFPTAALVVGVCLAVGIAMTAQAEGPVAVRLTDAQIEALADSRAGSEPGAQFKHPKIASVLLEVAESNRLRGPWRELAADRGLLLDGESVLVELRLNPESARSAVWYLENLGGRVRHHNVPSLAEVWLPVTAIEKSADHNDVYLIRPARLVQPTIGDVTSEGVAALNVNTGSVDYDYHDLGADGAGITIASIDAGYNGYAALQDSEDWPQDLNLRRFEVDGGAPVDCEAATCSNYQASDHGAATMEIVFDVAPGADYLTYRTTTVGDWYTALKDAADRGADVVTVSLSAPLDNVGDGGVCPPIWPAPCGTIAEAAAYARSQGTLVVNSAGNYRLEHWGGTYVDSAGALNWDGAGTTYNIGGPGGGYIYCYPNGYPLGVDLFWDDWTAPVDTDYDLYLYERRTNNRWTLRASSTLYQDGSPGQTPQEAIRYTVANALGGGGCGSGRGSFAIRVVRYSAATARNLQVFAGNWGGLLSSTPDRSLGFPADSPDVYAVGAADVTIPGTLEDYSAEGPVLGPGGSQAAPSPANPKPDGVSVSGVSTVTYGASGFGGTSSAAPHTAGIAAILTQLRNEKYGTPPAANNPAGMAGQLSLFALEDPTFPSTFDTTYGNGLVKLRFCNETVNVGAAEFVMLGLPCNQRGSMTVNDLLGGILGGDYGLWSWDAAAQQYDAIHTLADPGSVELVPGVGYWLWYENSFSVTMQGLVRDRTEPYRMALVGETPGLGRENFLGHPYDFDVAWPDVVVYHGGSEYDLAGAESAGILRNIMWKPYTATGYTEWDGTADPAEGTFHSYDGYWVKAWQDCELGIPVTPSTAAVSDGPDGGSPAPGWTVRLSASFDSVTATARIGQLPDASHGWDRRDAELMRSAETHQFYVVVPHPDWGETAGDYVRDYHNPRRTDSWQFEVQSNLGGSVVLRWDGPGLVLNQSVVVDLETGESFPASKLAKEGYRFEMDPGARGFLWRVR